MPKYIMTSEGPISVRQLERPDLPELPKGPTDPGYGIEGPASPSHPIRPSLPPKDEWPPLPPGLELPNLPGHPAFPIPPSPEFPMVPIEPETPGEPGTPGQLPELPPGMIWPPVRPELPDISNKFLALAYVFTSRTGGSFRWIIIDKDALPKPPAGGAGRPPQRPTPGPGQPK